MNRIFRVVLFLTAVPLLPLLPKGAKIRRFDLFKALWAILYAALSAFIIQAFDMPKWSVVLAVGALLLSLVALDAIYDSQRREDDAEN